MPTTVDRARRRTSLGPRRHPLWWLVAPGATGAFTRRLLPAVLVVPPLTGVFCVAGAERGWYGLRAGIALFAAASVLAFVALTVAIAVVLDRLERDGLHATQQLNAFFEHIPAAMALRDLDGRYLRVNEALSERHGRSSSDVAGRTLETFLSPEALAEVRDHDAAVVAELGPVTRMYRRISPAGDERELEVTRFPVFDADGILLGIGTFGLDVTERRLIEAEAEASARRLRSYLDSAPDATVVVDHTGVIQYANQQVTGLLGYAPEELVGERIEILVPDSVKDRHTGLRGGYNHERRPMGGLDLTARHREGHEVPVDISLGPVGAGPDAWTLASIRDVTEKRAAQEQLRAAEERYRHLAEHDALTGLWNRRRFSEELEAHLALCRRGQVSGALLSLDLDHFKTVNDTYGHHIGDELLVNVAEAMRRTLRASDGIARQGGDEFLMLLRSGDERGAVRAANALVDAVRHAAGRLAEQVGPDVARVTASVGVVVFDRLPAADLASAQVLIGADHALYAAKTSGRDRASIAPVMPAMPLVPLVSVAPTAPVLPAARTSPASG